MELLHLLCFHFFYLLSANDVFCSISEKMISIDPDPICLVKLENHDLVLLKKPDLVILNKMKTERQEDEAVGSLQHSLLIKA